MLTTTALKAAQKQNKKLIVPSLKIMCGQTQNKHRTVKAIQVHEINLYNEHCYEIFNT